MTSKLNRFLASILVAAGLLVAGPAPAVTITYQAIDLLDVTLGEDLWRYDYSVTGSFVVFGGFNVFFSPTLYSNLENSPPTVNADWLVGTTQPDPGLPADGFYTATALIDNPSVADLFTVTFVWLGGRATPGSQPFEVFDETFSPPLEIGQTRAPGQQDLPLPGTLALLALGVAGMRARRTLCLKN